MPITELSNIRQISRLIRAYPYGSLRKYPFLSKDTQDKYLINHIRSISRNSKNRIFIYSDAGTIQGFAVIKYSSWDSKIFGKNMWHLEYLVADETSFSSALGVKSCLLKTVLNFVRKGNDFHLSSKVDVSDITTVHALESSGFRLMDTLTTWLYRPAFKVPRIKTTVKIRGFCKNDLESLTALAEKSFYRHRFYLDDNLSNDKANKLYSQWVKNYCLDCSGSARVNVAENTKGVCGFVIYRLDKELEKISGYKVIGKGLMAVDRFAKGAAVGLIASVVRDVAARYDCAELDCLLKNFEVIRIFQKFNCRIIGVRHNFHYFP